MPTPAATATRQYLDNLWEEGRAAQDETGLKRSQEHINFQRGQQWPRNLPRGFPDFTLNLVDDVIQHKIGLLTDARPQLQVVSSNEEVNARPDVLRALEKCLRAIWDQHTWSEELARGIGLCEVICLLY